jgi:hypothetical protein
MIPRGPGGNLPERILVPVERVYRDGRCVTAERPQLYHDGMVEAVVPLEVNTPAPPPPAPALYLGGSHQMVSPYGAPIPETQHAHLERTPWNGDLGGGTLVAAPPPMQWDEAMRLAETRGYERGRSQRRPQGVRNRNQNVMNMNQQIHINVGQHYPPGYPGYQARPPPPPPPPAPPALIACGHSGLTFDDIITDHIARKSHDTALKEAHCARDHAIAMALDAVCLPNSSFKHQLTIIVHQCSRLQAIATSKLWAQLFSKALLFHFRIKRESTVFLSIVSSVLLVNISV